MDEAPGDPSGFPSLVWAADYHNNVIESLNRSFTSGASLCLGRLSAFSESERDKLLAEYWKETDLRSSFAILTLIEAAFRRDYQYRCEMRLKDDLSRVFRARYKQKLSRVSLEDDLFKAWIEYVSDTRFLMGELRSAFRFRNWLAHGRNGTPKLGRKYDFNALYTLADTVFYSLPLCGLDDA